MDVLVDLLPGSFTAKVEPSVKDSRQKQGYQQTKNLPNLPTEQAEVKTSSQTIVETERRTGDDRREQEMNRGRWLESRDRNDRRANASDISVKI
ncbi:hypothetical protein [Colwellia sp. C1TZA3]|uniref:hypothetical protein n=1 Tax=Colwellia sp. C1TZA3 TaxID=2508879 RepID=UPI0011B95A33|nr:hypothetical protein [Colwellia sp. C1TZA3]TWX73487.1 hypothetical protein ESZ39_03400 [Colwellia sp. C1TZA3]